MSKRILTFLKQLRFRAMQINAISKLTTFFAAVTIFLSGCTLNRSYWVEEQNAVMESGSERSWARVPYETTFNSAGDRFYEKLRIIEYDENGDRWESMQSSIARELVRNHSGPKVPVIVFIHGWRHNASPNDSNLNGFDYFLKKYSEYSQHEMRPPIGIFVGWRGASVNENGPMKGISTIPALLSVVDRKDGADKVAGIPLASDLWMLRKEALERGAKMVIVGHSFGGRIAERIVAPSVLASHHLRGTKKTVNVTTESKAQLSGEQFGATVDRSEMLADLTVLINPASESLYARQVKIGLRGWPANDPPAIISLKSETDHPTGKFWPLAEYIELAGKPTDIFLGRRYRLYHHEDLGSRRGESPWKYKINTAAEVTDRLLNGYIGLADSGKPKIINPNLDNNFITGEGYLVLLAHRRLINGHNGSPISGDEPVDSSDHGIFTERMSKFIESIVHDSSRSDGYLMSDLYKQLHPAD